MKIIFAVAAAIVLLQNVVAAGESPADSKIQWREWSPAVFEEARADGRLILLDLEAVWCHWCHVMDQTTYRDPQVIEIINARYLPVRVDQDANPALSNRYEDYGWPATVVFDGDGQEIIKRRGYIRPDWMYWMLVAVADAPDPVVHENTQRVVRPSTDSALSADQRELLESRYELVYDAEHGGWGRVHKFIHSDTLEYALTRAQAGSKLHEIMARQTLHASGLLLDPEWGGVYQYSDEVDWKSPHYEKIMSIQTTYIRTYALAYSLLGHESYLQWAKSIHDYLIRFLISEAGVFYTSQDADLDADTEGEAFFALSSDRRQVLGIPQIDTNIYARENGWVISALTALYGATGDGAYLDQARRAAEWIVKHRGLGGGGFRHGESATDIPFLADTLAMGRAFLDLYAATGERPWLVQAEAAAEFIGQHFLDAEGGGFAASAQSQLTAALPAGAQHLDSNIRMARFGNLLSHYTGKDHYRELAHHAMRYLVSPDVTDQRRLLGGVLLADWELNQQPVHVTVVGQKDDSNARQLFGAALRYGTSYKRLEWWDRREGAMPNPDVLYPKLEKAAAFVCTNKTCSAPVFESEQVLATIDRLSRP